MLKLFYNAYSEAHRPWLAMRVHTRAAPRAPHRPRPPPRAPHTRRSADQTVERPLPARLGQCVMRYVD